ncbi:hypothetical protein C8R45DRAFT_1222935, partial [Mycena sanguinolenta]
MKQTADCESALATLSIDKHLQQKRSRALEPNKHGLATSLVALQSSATTSQTSAASDVPSVDTFTYEPPPTRITFLIRTRVAFVPSTQRRHYHVETVVNLCPRSAPCPWPSRTKRSLALELRLRAAATAVTEGLSPGQHTTRVRASPVPRSALHLRQLRCGPIENNADANRTLILKEQTKGRFLKDNTRAALRQGQSQSLLPLRGYPRQSVRHQSAELPVDLPLPRCDHRRARVIPFIANETHSPPRYSIPRLAGSILSTAIGNEGDLSMAFDFESQRVLYLSIP